MGRSGRGSSGDCTFIRSKAVEAGLHLRHHRGHLRLHLCHRLHLVLYRAEGCGGFHLVSLEAAADGAGVAFRALLGTQLSASVDEAERMMGPPWLVRELVRER
jgi:hypothetical protein